MAFEAPWIDSFFGLLGSILFEVFLDSEILAIEVGFLELE